VTNAAEDIVDQAIAWHLRLDEASIEQWHEFTAWLEADPAHRDAYDQIVIDDGMIVPGELTAAPVAEPIPLRVAANDLAPRRSLWRWSAAGGSAVAAAFLAVAFLPGESGMAQEYRVETPIGVSRTVALDDGTSVDMNGGTRLKLRHGDARFAELESGEATFHVRHDAAHPFELVSGRYTVRDLGTMFNVTRDGPMLAVQVREGSVMFEPTGRAMTLKPGMALSIHDREDRPVLSRVQPQTVGSWREGVASFDGAPLPVVAQAVERSTGMTIEIAPDLSADRFTGTIHLAGNPETVIPRAAALMNANWQRKGKGWMLTPRSDGKD
jgi:transmembrane sensor